MEIKEKVIDISNSTGEKFLRRKTSTFDFNKYSKQDINALIKSMRDIMHGANGVGLAANQIGLDFSAFVARVNNKFYSFFNPQIIKTSEEMIAREEGCLSVPNRYAQVYRNDKIVLVAQDRNGKNVRIKAWGLLATVFQHEVDHLNGKLFIDRLK